MFVGNIVTHSNINVDKYFKVVNSLDDIIDGLPTLIVGWDIVKTINPNADFIDKKLSENIFWTFKKSERRDIFEDDFYDFNEYCYGLLIKDIEYKFIDLIQLNENELKNTFRFIKKNGNVVGYLYNKMLYIFVEKTIYGIDLNLLKYMDYNTDDVLYKIKSYCSVFLDNKEILIEYKDVIDMLNNEVKYIPFLYSIEHG
jgi:hypothetical protein